MSIQPQTYKRRLREHSDLSPMALHVAATIADLRYEKRLREHEPLPLTMPQLASACHMGSKNTARHYLAECLATGWVIGRAVYRDGRQQPNEYFICDPTASDAEVKRVTSVIASGGQILRSDARPEWVMRLDTVLRSKNNGAAVDAPPSGGGGSDEQGQVKTAPPDTAQPQAAAPVDAATLAELVGLAVGQAFAAAKPEPKPEKAKTKQAKRDAGRYALVSDPPGRVAAKCASCGSTRRQVIEPPTVHYSHGKDRREPFYECADCARPWLRRPAMALVSA